MRRTYKKSISEVSVLNYTTNIEEYVSEVSVIYSVIYTSENISEIILLSYTILSVHAG